MTPVRTIRRGVGRRGSRERAIRTIPARCRATYDEGTTGRRRLAGTSGGEAGPRRRERKRRPIYPPHPLPLSPPFPIGPWPPPPRPAPCPRAGRVAESGLVVRAVEAAHRAAGDARSCGDGASMTRQRGRAERLGPLVPYRGWRCATNENPGRAPLQECGARFQALSSPGMARRRPVIAARAGALYGAASAADP